MGVIDFVAVRISHRRGDVFQSHVTFLNLENFKTHTHLYMYEYRLGVCVPLTGVPLIDIYLT